MMNWNLDFFHSGEWDVVREKLQDLRERGEVHCPQREDLFKALEATKFRDVKVVLMGQDPYPNPRFATGLSFSIPRDVPREEWPPTLVNLLREYQDDLLWPEPRLGDLSWWARQGVLLWNAVPSCEAWKSASHRWPEWEYLTKEIVEKLDKKKNVVFIFVGGVSKAYRQYVKDCDCIETAHPSPRAKNASTPFFGSRIFSRANNMLAEIGVTPVDWKLWDNKSKNNEQEPQEQLETQPDVQSVVEGEQSSAELRPSSREVEGVGAKSS